MRRLVSLTVALLLLAPTVAAFGASFPVQHRTLQSVIVNAHITTPDPPVAESYSIGIVVRLYNAGGNELGAGQSPIEVRTESVPAGHSYEISWAGSGTYVSCSAVSYTGDPLESVDAGVFQPGRSSTHTLCVRSGGNPTVAVAFELVALQIQPSEASSSEPEGCDDDTDGHDECGSVDEVTSDEPATVTPELDDDGSPETHDATVDSHTAVAETRTVQPMDQEARE